MFNLKTSRIITHLGSWLLFFSLPVIFISGQHSDTQQSKPVFNGAYWLFCLTYIAVFYLVSELLIPRLYLKGRTYLYYGILVLLIPVVGMIRPFERLMQMNRPRPELMERHAPHPEFNGRDRHFGPPPPGGGGERRAGHMPADMISIFLYIMVVAMTMAIRITSQLHLAQQRALRAEADHAEAQLSFLKAQINPHFLFNTLNNIYTLSVINDANTSESIMKLSNIMRYIADETNKSFVGLSDELSCISDFIGLQKLRLGANTPVTYTVSGEILSQQIAPLLLMTFVENAFKYGVSKHQQSPILISITARPGELEFTCENQVFKKVNPINRLGIGIVNTRQRLAHLYPGRYALDITEKDNRFIVHLILQI